MFAEDDLIPISALQHFIVCPRQCALIHLEQTWVENERTAEGRIQHERVDKGGAELRAGVRRAYGLPLRSLSLGVTGRADVVEFIQDPTGRRERPFPVEHKRGRPKVGDEDRVQLCAQAMCLEEMLGVPVTAGALFYGERQRRTDVTFDQALRERTEEVTRAARAMLVEGRTPPPPMDAPCAACSLKSACRPEDFRGRRSSVAEWIASSLALPTGDGPP